MADDWSSPRTSNVFYLGDVLNIEASVSQADHQPLRLFVDSCVATLVPDQTSTPRYAFIKNHGCLTDAKTTGSSSQFMPRPQDGKLRMKLDAFRFYQDARSSIYITCLLKVTAASQRVSAEPVILAALGAVVGLVCVAVLGTVLYRLGATDQYLS
uniref:ZP domain-containing protein n=1 Tax=Lepisosteus oculatus TaxID=7918 RepID=W5N6F2_LEPOC